MGDKGLIKLYKKRWFVVNTQNKIYYFMSKIDKNPVGHINLKDILHITVPRMNSLNSGVTWGFELTVPSRVYYLYASSEQERLYWIEGLTSKITKAKKTEEKVNVMTSTMKELLVKKEQPSPSSSPFKIINDYSSTTQSACSATASHVSSSYNDDTDEDNSDLSCSYSNMSNKTKLEKELEGKENIISKLKEEKLAFEQYSKELNDEKTQLLEENKLMMEKLDTQSKDLLEKKINQMEIEIQELKQDLESLYLDLTQEKELTETLIKEKAQLEKVFNTEKKDLELKAEEYQTAKNKAIELMNSGSYETKQTQQKETTTNWPILLLNLERSSSKYRKERDEYYQKNLRLKKQMDDIIVVVEKQNPVLSKFDENLLRLKKNKKEFQSSIERVVYILPLLNQELIQLLGFVNGNQQFISTNNDLEFYDLIKNFKYQKNVDDEQYDFGWIDFSVNSSSTNFGGTGSGSSVGKENEPLIEGDTVQESKEILKKSIEYLDNCFNDFNTKNQTLITKTLPEEYKNQIETLFNLLESCNSDLLESKSQLKSIEMDIHTLPLHSSGRDEYENKMEILIEKIDPYLYGISGIDDSEILIKDLDKLQESLINSTNNFKLESSKTDEKINQLQITSDSVDKMIDRIFNNFHNQQHKATMDQLNEFLNQEKVIVDQQLLTPIKSLVHCLLSIKKKCILLKALDELQSRSNKLADYKAQEDDQLDMMVESVINKFHRDQEKQQADDTNQQYDTPIQWVIPPNFQRIDHGTYLFGTKHISTTILSGGLVVRVGGGFMTFQDFVKKYGKLETIKLIKLPNRRSMSIKRQSMNFGSSKNLPSFSPDKKTLNRPVSRTGNY